MEKKLEVSLKEKEESASELASLNLQLEELRGTLEREKTTNIDQSTKVGIKISITFRYNINFR